MLGKGDKHVLYSKDDTLLPRFVRGLPSPEERGFPDGATLGQSGLLKAGNVDNQLGAFPFNDSSLHCVVDLLQVIGEFKTCGPNVAP